MPRVNVKDKRKQQLIDANITSIAKHGLTETTIAHVSETAGMSRGIVNFYFTTKEAMMQETLAYLAADYAECWQQAVKEADSPQTGIKNLVQANFHSTALSQKRLAVWAAFWGQAGAHAAYKKIFQKTDADHLEILTDLYRKAGVQAPQLVASRLQWMIRGAWLQVVIAGSMAERKNALAGCENFAEESLRIAKRESAVVTPLHPKPARPKAANEPDLFASNDLFARK